MTRPQFAIPDGQPRWGNKHRASKAAAILSTLRAFSTFDLAAANWLDIGCGSGGIAADIAAQVKHITGVDPEPWPEWQELMQQYPNLTFTQGSYDTVPVPVGTADVVICNQVYEHVPDPVRLIRFIHETLRPGGLVYFAGPNLLFPIEPHTLWPFVHWLPRRFATNIMHTFGSHKVLDAYSHTYWRLQSWLADFEIINAVPHILRRPEDYGRKQSFWRLLSAIPAPILDAITFLSPAFVFILRKP